MNTKPLFEWEKGGGESVEGNSFVASLLSLESFDSFGRVACSLFIVSGLELLGAERTLKSMTNGEEEKKVMCLIRNYNLLKYFSVFVSFTSITIFPFRCVLCG